jgi:hypothetical protein
MTKPTSAESRFWKRLEKTETCWNWLGAPTPKGYGNIVDEAGKTHAAHRFAYELLVGPIPDGMLVDHACRNKGCVNPNHLRLATNKQNLENLSGPYVTNQTGYRGVSRQGSRFVARARHNGVLYYAGRFSTAEEAAEAAALLRLKLFTHNDLDRQAS